MYEQAEPVRAPVSGLGSGQTSRTPPLSPTVHMSGSGGRVRYGNDTSGKREEDQETSDMYEEAEAVKRGATYTPAEQDQTMKEEIQQLQITVAELSAKHKNIQQRPSVERCESGELETPDAAFISGFGRRSLDVSATFSRAFRTPPVVTVGLKHVDHFTGHIHVSTTVASVSTTSLTVRIATWGGSRLYFAAVYWMACA
ncbi:Hypp4509 [Branchiostoma lanceolatum]|uniref:Hypp4509 protein n=1 Tax=Branchiostoma lanceolatum TaxID=7740 RepID=A0A8K0A9V7_BRALA|nr:Hypp4509 [Branchiostoma lanceolatum]